MTIHVNTFTAVAVHLSDRDLDDMLPITDSLIDYDDDFNAPILPQTGGLIGKPVSLQLDDEVLF